MGWVPLGHTSFSGRTRLKMSKIEVRSNPWDMDGLSHTWPHLLLLACHYIPDNAKYVC